MMATFELATMQSTLDWLEKEHNIIPFIGDIAGNKTLLFKKSDGSKVSQIQIKRLIGARK